MTGGSGHAGGPRSRKRLMSAGSSRKKSGCRSMIMILAAGPMAMLGGLLFAWWS